MKRLGAAASYFVKPYWSPLILSVMLMAIAGAAHAMMAVLIRPDLRSRARSDIARISPSSCFRLPFAGTPFYLHQLAPE